MIFHRTSFYKLLKLYSKEDLLGMKDHALEEQEFELCAVISYHLDFKFKENEINKK